jgi:hypothetical protein
VAQPAWRPTFAFLCGIALAALPLNTLSVYVFHDVDKDKIDKLNLAFSQLNAEMTMFAIIAACYFS